MKKIDLNCDMGELKPGQTANFDAEIMRFISSCNIACGFHSGSPQLMEKTIQLAIQHDVKIGAHPSYHDRENFGRKSIKIDREILLSDIRYQICALKGMAKSLGASLYHVKAHGALYNDMQEDEELAKSYVQLVKQIDPGLKIYALAGSSVIEICHAEGIIPVNEGFADRRYESVDRLRSRDFPDAVLQDSVAILEQIDDFLAGKVRIANREFGPLSVETICLHSDTPGAVRLGEMIHDHLKRKHVDITANL